MKCNAGLRYDLAVFEQFAAAAPEAVKAQQIAAMPLPRPRKLSAQKADSLAEHIAASSIAKPGSRSEADFAVCCYAIRQGMTREELWPQVEKVGKFGEQGRRYLDTTWDNAEYDVRASTYDKLAEKAEKASSVDGKGNGQPQLAGERPTIEIDTATTPVGATLRRITDCLLKTSDCYLRSQQLVVVHRDAITTIITPPEFAGLLNQHVEFFFVDKDGGEYRPLTAAYAGTWLDQRVEQARLPEIKLFTRNPVYTQDWRLVAPGYDRESGIYYAGETVAPRQGTHHLDTLLQDFGFKSPADRTNYLGVLLTTVLIPHFIGAKPSALFNGNQPGVGKSILAQIIAILRDGHTTVTVSFNPNDEEFEKRLGAIVRRGVTTVIIDNAKGQGRKARIESACVERSITDPILSFRLLGKSLEIRAENSHIFCITANTADGSWHTSMPSEARVIASVSAT